MEDFYQHRKSPWVIILSILLGLALIGGGAGIYKFRSDWKFEKDKNTILQKQIDELKKTSDSKKTSTNEESTAKEECASTLTESEESEISDWETTTNSTQKYSLKHPSSTEVFSEENERIVLKDNSDDANIVFTFASDDMSATDIDPSYTKEEEKTIKIACADATEVFFSDNDAQLIAVTFDKNNIHHLIMLTYTDLGASISGDILDTFNLMLKTITFTD